MIDLNIIKACIKSPEIRVISFDIFDTLVERPVIYPSDIFILLNDRVKDIIRDSRFDFYRHRKDIEREARQYLSKRKKLDGEITFDQIYEYFRRKFRFTDEQKNRIMSLEVELESQLLSSRKAGKDLYNEAVASGKKIICVSDMYHNHDFLKDVLGKNGYNGIDKIYVSSEIKKRKDSGELFDHVLSEEKILPHEMLHIGDNHHSDFAMPLICGITAFQLFPARDLFFRFNNDYRVPWDLNKNYSPLENLISGFYINKWAEELFEADSFFPEKKHMGYFAIGPVLFSIAQYLRSNRDIQSRYPEIHFASRDGWLPMKAYDFLCEKSSETYIRSAYLYCGRVLYNVSYYKDGTRKGILKYFIQRIKKSHVGKMTIGGLFDSMCYSCFFKADDSRRELPVSDEMKNGFRNITDIISERHSEIDAILKQKKKNIDNYYSTEVKFSDKARALVFDSGYNGSVSDSIMRVTGKRVDKVYICETPLNRLKDKLNKTKTYLCYCDLGKIRRKEIVHVFEDIFSSLEDQCVDISLDDNQFTPVFDNRYPLSETTKNDVLAIQNGAMEFIYDIQQTFGRFLDSIEIKNITFSLEPLWTALSSKTDMSVRHFENIVFPDSYYNDFRPLSEKVEPENREHLLRTNFVNRRVTLGRPVAETDNRNFKIGLHIHLYHIYLAASFVSRLRNIDTPYDLYISVVSDRDEKTARVIFNSGLLPTLNKLTIQVFPNRGRDVAPWIVGFRNELQNYDLACHVHTKKSDHFAWGDSWRDYLLDNLITGEAFRDIYLHFLSNPGLGVLFPPIYKDVFKLWTSFDLTQIEETDRVNCMELMERMRIDGYLTKHKLFFSVGTMFWYRPAALRPLFDLDLKFEDFPQEPIDITGSWAHAIERLTAIVAESQGYSTFCYIRQDDLLKKYYENMLDTIIQSPGSVKPGKTLSGVIRSVGLFFLPVGTARREFVKKYVFKLLFFINRLKSKK